MKPDSYSGLFVGWEWAASTIILTAGINACSVPRSGRNEGIRSVFPRAARAKAPATIGLDPQGANVFQVLASETGAAPRVRRARVLQGLVTGLALSALAVRPARAQGLPVLRVLGPANDDFKDVYYAVQSGLFKKNGLDVQPTIVASGSFAAAALSGGGADLAFTNILTVLQAATHGIPMVLVAPGALGNSKGSNALLTLNESPIHTARDLNGKVIAAPSLRGFDVAATYAWMDENGADYKSLRVIELTQSAALQFLETGRADAVLLLEPQLSQILSTGKVRVVIAPLDALGPQMVSGIAALSPYVDAHRDTIRRFAEAMHTSILYTNSHFAEMIPIVASFTGLTTDAVAKTNRATDFEYLDPRSFQPLIELCARFGLIEKSIPAQQIISSVALASPK